MTFHLDRPLKAMGLHGEIGESRLWQKSPQAQTDKEKRAELRQEFEEKNAVRGTRRNGEKPWLTTKDDRRALARPLAALVAVFAWWWLSVEQVAQADTRAEHGWRFDGKAAAAPAARPVRVAPAAGANTPVPAVKSIRSALAARR